MNFIDKNHLNFIKYKFENRHFDILTTTDRCPTLFLILDTYYPLKSHLNNAMHIHLINKRGLMYIKEFLLKSLLKLYSFFFLLKKENLKRKFNFFRAFVAKPAHSHRLNHYFI